jgi:hypothetical protein
MKKLLISTLTAALLAATSLAQNQGQANDGSESQNRTIRLAPGTIIRVELAKSIDAKKAKVGDEVIAKTLDDFLSDKSEVLAPRGSRVLGHVTEVSPHQGESASALAIAFDKIVLKSGTDVPLKASIQAIGSPESNAGAVGEPIGGSGNSGEISSMPSTSRGAYGGAAANPNIPDTANSPGAVSQEGTSSTAVNGRLSPNAQGVVGMSGVSLSTGAAQDSLLTSPKHNVKLDSGTQMILRVIS